MIEATAESPNHEVLLRPSPSAAVWSGSGHTFDHIATPGVSLAPGDLLVEVELATVCASDLDSVLGKRPAETPLVLGHEQVGRVVAIGDHAHAANGTPLMVGMRVIWSVAVSCGDCDRCQRGIEQKCRSLIKYGHDRVRRGWELSGGFSTHVQVLAGTAVVIVDEELPAAVAAPASCATATVAAAFDAATTIVPLAGSTVVILGAGLLGLTASAMATDAGATVIVSEPDAVRRARAVDFGALVTDPGELCETLLRVQAGGASEPLIVLELSGRSEAVAQAIAVCGVGGVVVVAGSVAPDAAVPLDAEDLLRRLVTIRGVHNYSAVHLDRAATYLSRAWQRYPFAGLVGATFALDDIDAAIALAASGAHPRVALNPRIGADGRPGARYQREVRTAAGARL